MSKYLSITISVFICFFLFSCSDKNTSSLINSSLIDGANNRLLKSKAPYKKSDWSDIYYSLLEIKRDVRSNPDLQISFITEWTVKIDEILKSNANNQFKIHSKLLKMQSIDYDMLARSYWFPNDFRFAKEDQLLLDLMAVEVSK